MALLFNQIYINEEMPPKYTYFNMYIGIVYWMMLPYI